MGAKTVSLYMGAKFVSLYMGAKTVSLYTGAKIVTLIRCQKIRVPKLCPPMDAKNQSGETLGRQRKIEWENFG